MFRNRLTTPFDGRSELRDKSSFGTGQPPVDSNNIQEKHPDENISIVERPEDIIQANSKHKLYFNPAYLEPELLMVIQFVTDFNNYVNYINDFMTHFVVWAGLITLT